MASDGGFDDDAGPWRKDPDFFVSYTASDEGWAEWIAWQLEEAGAGVTLQKWDFGPGKNFVREMNEAVARSKRTILVLSPEYLASEFATDEWEAVYSQDRTKLLPVRIADFEPSGLLGPIVYIDLVGKTRGEARTALLNGLRTRQKPDEEPDFPGESERDPQAMRSRVTEPTFPGVRDRRSTGPVVAQPPAPSGPHRESSAEAGPRWLALWRRHRLLVASGCLVLAVAGAISGTRIRRWYQCRSTARDVINRAEASHERSQWQKVEELGSLGACAAEPLATFLKSVQDSPDPGGPLAVTAAFARMVAVAPRAGCAGLLDVLRAPLPDYALATRRLVLAALRGSACPDAAVALCDFAGKINAGDPLVGSWKELVPDLKDSMGEKAYRSCSTGVEKITEAEKH